MAHIFSTAKGSLPRGPGHLDSAVDMTIEQIKLIQQATPFRPFSLETKGGKEFNIQNADMLFFGPAEAKSDTVIVYGMDGLVHLVNEDSIASLTIEQAP